MKFEAESILQRAMVFKERLTVRISGLEKIMDEYLDFVNDLESYLEEVARDDT